MQEEQTEEGLVEQTESGEAIAQIQSLGVFLKNGFEVSLKDRQLIEQEWLKNLRQYKGVHDPEDLSDKDPNSSEAFFKLTRARVVATDARVMDLLFPGGGEKNWTIDTTPEPKLPKPVEDALKLDFALQKYQAMMMQLAEVTPTDIQLRIENGELPHLQQIAEMLQQGQVPPEFAPSKEDMRKLVKGEADSRAELMSGEINDQLTEGKYRRVIKKVVHSGHLYGTGWLKGPLVKSMPITAWDMDENGEWVTEQKTISMPFFEFVSIWDVYPESLDVDSVDECEGIYQRHVMTKKQVRELTRREAFKKDVITKYLKDHPQGDVVGYRNHETELRELKEEDQGSLSRTRGRRYEVIEYTGWADGEMLYEAGLEIREEEREVEYKVNVWVVGNEVIKAEFHPYDDSNVDTYHQYLFEQSDTSVFGNGVPEILRDPQRIMNAGLQALLDNMGDAAEANYEVNGDLLDPTELRNIDGLMDKKVILRRGKGLDAQYDAIRKIQGESRITEFLALIDLARNLADEATALPRYASGEADVGGAGETAKGLSMLMAQANIVLKDPITNFDEGITKPFLRALYHWNMQFNERNEIKGDYAVVPTGSTSLMAKEIYTEQFERFANGTTNDLDRPWIKRGELNRERAKNNGVDADRFVRSDEEFKDYMASMQQEPEPEQEAA